jgi:RNA polymerase sigma-54 factor
MALKQQLTPRLSQRLVITPSLQQSIKMLQMNKLEIEALVQTELQDNVVLEIGTDEPANSEQSDAQNTEENIRNSSVEETAASDKKDDPFEKIDIEEFFADYMDSAPLRKQYEHSDNEDTTSFENTLTKPASLSDHLSWQLELSISDEILKKIGHAIIGNLNDEGYLKATLDEIMAMDSEFTSENVEKAIKLIQSFDPAGIAAADLKQCLLLQLDHLGINDSVCVEIIGHHLENIQNHNYEVIQKNLNISKEQLKEKIDIIKQLDPKPGLKYNVERIVYIEPEVYIDKENGEFKVKINDDGMPKLRISSFYQKLGALKADGDKDAVNYIREKMKSAVWLLKSFDLRQKTIYRVSESILRHQMDFFRYGEKHLKPMVLSDIAQDVGLHESTISRVVNNKYMHTPLGVFELKYFFQRGVTSDRGDDISSLIVKKKIKDLTQNENHKKPLSDAAIESILSKEGLKIARRTVAKYREEMNIPSSNTRKKQFE